MWIHFWPVLIFQFNFLNWRAIISKTISNILLCQIKFYLKIQFSLICRYIWHGGTWFSSLPFHSRQWGSISSYPIYFVCLFFMLGLETEVDIQSPEEEALQSLTMTPPNWVCFEFSIQLPPSYSLLPLLPFVFSCFFFFSLLLLNLLFQDSKVHPIF